MLFILRYDKKHYNLKHNINQQSNSASRPVKFAAQNLKNRAVLHVITKLLPLIFYL